MNGILCDIDKLTRIAPTLIGEEISTEQLNEHEIADLLTKLSELEKTSALAYYKIKQKCKWINIVGITFVSFVFYFDVFLDVL